MHAPAALLGGTEHPGTPVCGSWQPTGQGEREPGHQLVMHVLIRQAPQRTQQRQQQKRFLAVTLRLLRYSIERQQLERL